MFLRLKIHWMYFKSTGRKGSDSIARETGYTSCMLMDTVLVKSPDAAERLNYDYAYTPVGNVDRKLTEHGEYIYGYDDLYRLTSAVKKTRQP